MLIQKRKDKEKQALLEGQVRKTCPGTPIVVPYRPGVQEWWKDCRERDLVQLGSLGKEEKEYLPDKMIRCLSGTDKLGQQLKRAKDGKGSKGKHKQ